jgi:hypothetical protein
MPDHERFILILNIVHEDDPLLTEEEWTFIKDISVIVARMLKEAAVG